MKNNIIILILIAAFGVSFAFDSAFARSRKEEQRDKERIEAIKEKARNQEFPKTETELAYSLTAGNLFPVIYKGETFDSTRLPLTIAELNKMTRYDEYNNQYFYDKTGTPYFYSVPHKQSYYYKSGKGPGKVETPEAYKARWRQAIENKIAEEKANQITLAEDAAVQKDKELKILKRQIRDDVRRDLEREYKNNDLSKIVKSVTQ